MMEDQLDFRFARFVEPEPMSGCFLWVGHYNKQGYGYFKVNGRNVRAHRFAYERTHGPIPEGKDVLHSCDTPFCVCPQHLRAGTDLENMQDRDRRGRNGHGRKTTCPQGHPYDEKNTHRDRAGKRHCRRCNADRGLARYRSAT